MAETTDNTTSSPANEEISLVDLVAVLLKRRKIIIVSTVAALVLAVLGYFVYPPVALASRERKQEVEVSTSFMLGSSLRVLASELETNNFVIQSLNDPVNILAALRQAGYETIEKVPISAGADEKKAMYTVRRRIVDNKGFDGASLKESARPFSVRSDKGVLYVMFKNSEEAKAKAFLVALVNIVQADLFDFMRPFAERAIESYERLLEVQNPTDMVEESIAQGYVTYSRAKSLVAGTVSTISVLRPPYAFVPELSIEAIRKDTFKKAVLLVFGVFFMSLFAAFVVQYVDSVKKDPQAMAKIKDAMGRS